MKLYELPKNNMFSSVSITDKMFFTKHLSVMIKSGITLIEALETLISQTKNKEFKKILAEMQSDIENGQTLTKAMKKHPNVFDDLYISLIEIGEESGSLEENLHFLSKQIGKDYALRKKVQGALLYPAIIMGATAVVGLGVSFFILPKLIDLFSTFKVELPLSTKILLFFANLLQFHTLELIAGIVVFIGVTLALWRIPAVQYKLNYYALKLPIFGKLLLDSQQARFTRNLGTLLKSGIILTTGLEVIAKSLGNKIFKDGLTFAQNQVQTGKTLSYSLQQFPYPIFAPLVTRMIAIGEKTGKLDETLLYLGDFYEEEIDDTTKNLSTLLEPVLLLIIGLVVGFVALAIISPIYQLTGSIGR